MTDNLGSTYGDFIRIQIDDSPIDSATSDPPQALHPGGMDVRRYSDNTSDRPIMPLIRRSASHPDIPPIQTRNNLYPYYDNAVWSPPTPSSSLGVPSPYVAHEMKPFPDSYPDSFSWDPSQTILQQTAPPSPDTQLLSPLSDTSSRFELSPEPTRGRLRSSSIHRHSPYPRSRSVSRMTTDMSHLSITGTSPSSPHPPYQQYLTSGQLLEHDSTLPDLVSFEDVISGSGPPGTYASEVQSPFGEDVTTLFRDDYSPVEQHYSPVEQHISPLASQSGFRAKVGSEAIEKAASGRRKRPGEFRCTIPGCSATFTAKHNLQSKLRVLVSLNSLTDCAQTT